MILWFPDIVQLTACTYPWSRENKRAGLTNDDDYCFNTILKNRKFTKSRLLLDLVDSAVFHFITGNKDKQWCLTLGNHTSSAMLMYDTNSRMPAKKRATKRKASDNTHQLTYTSSPDSSSSRLAEVLSAAISADPILGQQLASALRPIAPIRPPSPTVSTSQHQQSTVILFACLFTCRVCYMPPSVSAMSVPIGDAPWVDCGTLGVEDLRDSLFNVDHISQLPVPPETVSSSLGVFTYGAATVPEKLKTAIWYRQFVDMAKLCFGTTTDTLTTVQTISSVTSVQKGGSAPITSILLRSKAFQFYVSIFTVKYPSEASQMFQYMSLIQSLSQHSPYWQLYDQKFRTQRATRDNPWVPCSY